jgi:hypothetical protein
VVVGAPGGVVLESVAAEAKASPQQTPVRAAAPPPAKKARAAKA